MAHYLVKSNPNKWRIFNYLEDLGDDAPERWTVGKTVKPGDILFIGAAGEAAAILAKATASSEPFIADAERSYYLDPAKSEQKTMARLDPDSFENYVVNPITEQELAGIPELQRVSRWLHVQGGHTRLSDDEYDALERLAVAKI
jgi:hypothetical protein